MHPISVNPKSFAFSSRTFINLRSPTVRILIFTAIFFMDVKTQAQWQADGVVLCDSSVHNTFQTFPALCADNEGGAIVCWRDMRSRSDFDIYAQRVDSAGYVQWEHNGKPIAVYPSNQDFPQICSDFGGGAFIAWEDRREGDSFPFIQHITKSGQFLFPAGGVQATTTPGIFLSIAPDHKGGVLLGYSTVHDICVQRLDSTGARLWGDSGVFVTRRAGDIWPGDVTVSTDLQGGLVVAWTEGSYPHNRSYIQHIDSNGEPRWAQDGIQLSDTSKNVIETFLCSDMKGGVIVDCIYSDASSRVQRISGAGEFLWIPGGVPLWPSGSGGGHRNSSDGRSGSFVGFGTRIHHIDSLGTKVWGDSGAVLFVPAGGGGITNSSQAIDGRGGVFNFAEYVAADLQSRTLQMQWVDSSGISRLGAIGRPVTKTIQLPQQYYPRASSDGRGGALVSWEDLRSSQFEIYVARVNAAGTVTAVKEAKELGALPKGPELRQNYPNPFNPETVVEFHLPERSYTVIAVYDILGKRISTLVNDVFTSGTHKVVFSADALSSGIYIAKLYTPNSTQAVKMLLIR